MDANRLVIRFVNAEKEDGWSVQSPVNPHMPSLSQEIPSLGFSLKNHIGENINGEAWCSGLSNGGHCLPLQARFQEIWGEVNNSTY